MAKCPQLLHWISFKVWNTDSHCFLGFVSCWWTGDVSLLLFGLCMCHKLVRSEHKLHRTAQTQLMRSEFSKTCVYWAGGDAACWIAEWKVRQFRVCFEGQLWVNISVIESGTSLYVYIYRRDNLLYYLRSPQVAPICRYFYLFYFISFYLSANSFLIFSSLLHFIGLMPVLLAL